MSFDLLIDNNIYQTIYVEYTAEIKIIIFFIVISHRWLVDKPRGFFESFG